MKKGQFYIRIKGHFDDFDMGICCVRRGTCNFLDLNIRIKHQVYTIPEDHSEVMNTMTKLSTIQKDFRLLSWP